MTAGPALLITNGDAAGSLLRKAFQGAEVLPWRDVLHDGPVPLTRTFSELSNIRVEFLASKAWGEAADLQTMFDARDRGLAHQGEFASVTLWFEHDLYDQLQLIQLLDWFGDQRRDGGLSLVQADDFLGRQSLEALIELQALEAPISDDQRELSQRAWAAFRQPNPEAWAALLSSPLGALPHLAAAIRRSLEELPQPGSGISRTERAILEAIKAGVSRPLELFTTVQQGEDAAFMGDWSFWDRLDGLANAASPLIEGLTGSPFRPDWSEEQRATYFKSDVEMTDFGAQVLAGKQDHATRNPIDRWVGGTHLTNDALWRWDSDQERLIAPD